MKNYSPKKGPPSSNKPITSDFIFVSVKKQEDLVSEWFRYVRVAEELKQLTKGKINLFRANAITSAALKLWQDMSVPIQQIQAEPIDEHEHRFILGCFCCGLAFYEQYEGMGYEADVNSFYPWLLSSSSNFPIRKGTFEKISNQEFVDLTYFKFGIYQCKITPSSDANINRLFKFNPKNYYTHHDMKRAKELGLQMEMIQSDNPNFLFYPPETRIRYDMCFKTYFKCMYELKSQIEDLEVKKTVKIMSNCVWGALCEKKLRKAKIGSEKMIDTDEPIKLLRTTKVKDGEDELEYYIKNDTFRTPYCRIGVFLTALGRSTISQVMNDRIDQIVRCNTDGFVSKTPIEGLKGTQEMGDFKIKQGMVKVIKGNRTQWL